MAFPGDRSVVVVDAPAAVPSMLFAKKAVIGGEHQLDVFDGEL